MTNRKSGKNFTFSLIALNPDNRLRYPPVSLFFMMCLCWQMVLEFQENLFGVKFFPVKVGVGGRFSWCRLVSVTKVMLQGFQSICEHCGRYRGSFWIPFGVAISGIGVKSAVHEILLGDDESGPMLGLKLLVGPRWREFHCGRRGAGMKFSQRILYFEFKKMYFI